MEPYTQRCLQILDQIRATPLPSADEEVQKELACLVGLVPAVEKTRQMTLIETLAVAVENLTSNAPNLLFARELREKLQKEVRQNNSMLRRIFMSESPAVRVILGLGLLLYFVIPASPLLFRWGDQAQSFFQVETRLIVFVALCGATGSIVSIMVRIRDFSQDTEIDPAILFFTGFFKPIIGVSFALFVFSILKAGLLPLKIEGAGEHFFYFALAFVSGFSERLAKDAVTKMEDTLAGARPPQG